MSTIRYYYRYRDDDGGEDTSEASYDTPDAAYEAGKAEYGIFVGEIFVVDEQGNEVDYIYDPDSDGQDARDINAEARRWRDLNELGYIRPEHQEEREQRPIVPKPLTVLNGTITITRRWDDYHACITNEKGLWGCGTTSAEAIGQLIRAHDADLLPHLLLGAQANRPTIVTLCGSTRFCAPEYQDTGGMTPWRRAQYEETLAGRMVWTIGVDFKSDAALALSEADKERLDRLHLEKIRYSDEILVINVGGYVGPSTRKEIDFAQALGKRIRWLEPEHAIEA